MDIFAHGLWTGVSYGALKRNTRRPINLWLAVFWGVIPDIFAFTAPLVYMFWAVVFGGWNLEEFFGHARIEPVAHEFPLYLLTNILYGISHSLIVFVLVFIVVALVRKKVMWELGAWFLHILIDIPTHSYAFFPTPFLWPILDFRVNGFAWSDPRFMAINYTLIAISLLAQYLTRHRKKNF